MSVEAVKSAMPPRGFVARRLPLVERLLLRHVCEPLVRRIPPSIHPNTLTLATQAICWVTLALALVSVRLTPLPRALALIGAAIGMFAATVGDCLDGMHARRTNQSSRLGSILDHWLDAIAVPLGPIGLSFALEMDPWAFACLNITAAMIYHGQLVLYHHTGEFLDPTAANGVEAQVATSIGYFAAAVALYLVPRETPWLEWAISVAAVLWLVVQLRCNWFYDSRLGKLRSRRLTFALICAAFGALYLTGAVSAHVFALCLACVSFRISGSYVLATVIGRKYSGWDPGIAAFLVAAWVLLLAGPSAALGGGLSPAAVSIAACAYMVLRNLDELAREPLI